MTQAYNLSQLANNLDSSGRLDATDGLVNAVPVANGGTGASTVAAARSNLDVPTRTGGDASGTWSINITGSSGSSATASELNTANFTIEQQGSSLVFLYNGVAIASITNAGVFSAAQVSATN